MSRYYHNLTKGLFNIYDSEDFFDEYEEGDDICFTEDGCAWVYAFGAEELQELLYNYNHGEDD